VIDAPLDLLLEIMQLSGYWRIPDLFEEMQREIVDRRLMTPLTVDSSQSSSLYVKYEISLLTFVCTSTRDGGAV
jgi:hypothetical protein